MIRSVTNCIFFPALQWDVPLYTSCVVVFQALCLCVPTSCLKATAVPVAPLPFLPQRSERRLLFSVVCRCLSGERGQGGAAGRGAEPPAEQPAAAGGVAEHGGSPHQSHWAAVQRQQALLASPLLYSPRLAAARTNTQISRGKDANRAACLYAQYTYFVHAYLQKQTHTRTHTKTHTSSSNYVCLIPESWTCQLVREYANQLIQKTFSTSLHRLTNGQLPGCCVGVLCQSASLVVYVTVCVPHVCARVPQCVCVCVCVCMCVHLLLYLASNTWWAGLK